MTGVFAGEPGPKAAVEAFLVKNKNFIVDASRDRFVITYNPMGYPERVKESMKRAGTYPY